MKKTLLYLMLVLPGTMNAQTIPVDSFENWTITNYNELDAPWITSNENTLPSYNVTNVKKIAGYNSTSAVRMETYVSGVDTEVGYIVNTSGDPLSGEGGVPYSQKPTAINGYWRYNIPGTDTGTMLVVFKKNGIPYSTNFFKIKGTGSQPTFTAFSFPITLGVTPDSVIVAVACGNILSGTGMNAASWLELDSLRFTGPSVTQTIPNGNFEAWLSKTQDRPNSWTGFGSITRSTDKYSGTYAANLISKDDGTGYITSSEMSRMTPHTLATTDTLSCYYKYSTSGADAAQIMIYAFDHGMSVGSPLMYSLPAVSAYTKFKMPFAVTTLHDSLSINIYSSSFSHPAIANSALTIDQLEIMRQSVGINDITTSEPLFSVYPNPAVNNITVSAKNGLDKLMISMIDIRGQQVMVNIAKINNTSADIAVSHLVSGTYRLIVRDMNGAIVYTQPFIKQ